MKNEKEIQNKIMHIREIISMYKKMDLEPLVLKYVGYLEALQWVLENETE